MLSVAQRGGKRVVEGREIMKRNWQTASPYLVSATVCVLHLKLFGDTEIRRLVKSEGETA